MKQADRVLRHMRDFGSISSLEAFQEYGITRLSGRIYDLRMAGHTIKSTPESRQNRYGESTTFARYRLA